MDKVFYLDTVFDSGESVTQNYSKLCYAAPSHANDPRVVIVKGAWEPGDGGGGEFLWDENGGTDDGGTIIVPTVKSEQITGCWRRVFSSYPTLRNDPNTNALMMGSAGILNVKWFGARGNGLSDDTKSIQAAIMSVWRSFGGTVYFPQGVYWIGGEGITIPKMSRDGYPYPLTLRGEGPAGPWNNGVDGGSTLYFAAPNPDHESDGIPMFQYSNKDIWKYNIVKDENGNVIKNENGNIEFHSFENLSFARDYSYGSFIQHAVDYSLAAPNNYQRIRLFISRCLFQGTTPDKVQFLADDNPSADALIYIDGGWNGCIQDVVLHGGKTCIYLRGSRYTLDRVMTEDKGGTCNFIILDGGGGHSLRNIRSEGGIPWQDENGQYHGVYALHVKGTPYFGIDTNTLVYEPTDTISFQAGDIITADNGATGIIESINASIDGTGIITFTPQGGNWLEAAGITAESGAAANLTNSHVSQLIIDNFTTEAYKESIQIYIERAYSVQLRDVSLGSHQDNSKQLGNTSNHAIKIGKFCSNIQILGGEIPSYGGTYNINAQPPAGNCSILIEGGARHILVDNLTCGDGVNDDLDNDGLGNIVIDDSVLPVVNVRVRVIERLNDHRGFLNGTLQPINNIYAFEKGIVSDAWMDTDNATNCLKTMPNGDAGYEYHTEPGTRIYRVSPGAELKGISPAYEGAIVTLIISVPVDGSGNPLPDDQIDDSFDVTMRHRFPVDPSKFNSLYFPTQSDLVVKPGNVIKFIRQGAFWYMQGPEGLYTQNL